MVNINTYFIALLIIIVTPQFGFSQTINKRSKNIVSEKEQTWKPVNEFADYKNIMQTSPDDVGTPVLTNIFNGVSFYTKHCMVSSDSNKIILLKLVNSNNYPVKISWRISPTAPTQSVEVPALSEVDGSCSFVDNNQTNLAIQIPAGTDTEEMKKYALTHLTVIEEKDN